MNTRSIDAATLEALSTRLGPVHARQRLGIEDEKNRQVLLGRGANFLHLEHSSAVAGVIRGLLRLSGMYSRGRRNALALDVREPEFHLPRLPKAFDGFRILHLSDLHLDMSPDAVPAVIERVRALDYDLCVLTGDYRARTHGAIEDAVDGMRRLRTHLRDPVYAVLGNHDSIRMVPAFEAMGIRMLLNEAAVLQREGAALHLVGVDDAHYFRMDNIEKAVAGLPEAAPAILLSHTPEIYRQATHAGFDLFLCGHTHGGQICLPGGVPVILEARIPRRLGRGAWRHGDMQGYTSTGAGTSIVDVRFNCPGEITVHRLRAGRAPGRQ
ncbi:MAG: metallophosphoesterase [Pseudomonadales bacterium]|jgi:predicted MPP superfamily phosphohydrolase|nr:metallophosphoesterase [Pseudomonadales bacterium]